MAFTRALYYPHIEIHNDSWLKTSILYWDEIQTIVPASIKRPYSTRTAIELFDARVLSPLFVHPGMTDIEGLTEKVIEYISSPEAERLFRESGLDEFALLHPEKLPADVRRLVEIHPEKLPYVVQDQLGAIFGGTKNGWMHVHPAFANYYLTLLATELSSSTGLGLLTDMPSSDQLSSAARLDSPMGLLNLRDTDPYERRYRRHPTHQMPRETAQAALAHLTLNRVAISADTPIEKILKFKQDHASQLGRFRTNLAELTKTVDAGLSVEALQQQVSDVYSNDVAPAINELKECMKQRGIKYIAESFLKISSLSMGTGALLTQVGLSIPQALLAAAGISLVVSTVLYNLERREQLRKNDLSYVLAAESHFRR